MRAAFAVAALAFPLVATAEFSAIGETPAVLYDAPSTRATRLYVASRNLPVEIIATDGAWVKVRDPFGALSWIERKLLADKRTVIVAAPVADVRQRPEDAAPVAFRAQQGVVLDLVEAGVTGWARVRHADGSSGFVRISQVWGL
ncbi:MAG TPA: SH3 domain-containing protein [Burkholderiales bacterium]|jgi:SH3-like domain-containing protein|nr:SH3 domain-containing protein [Burkholderiales bacterium]